MRTARFALPATFASALCVATLVHAQPPADGAQDAAEGTEVPADEARGDDEAGDRRADEEADEDEDEADEAAPESRADLPLHTLDSLLEAARASYPGIEARSLAIDAAEARLTEARLSPFFQFRIEGALAVAPEARGTPVFSPDSQVPLGNRWRPAGQVEVEGIIPFSVTKLQDARRAARAGVRAAEGDRRRSLARLTFDVRRAYFSLQLALDIQQMISEGSGKLRRAARRLTRRLEEGDPEANELDAYRLASALAEVEARASEAERLELSARSALRALTGLDDFRVSDCPSAPVAVELAPIADYRGRATAERPEMAMLEAALDARRADLRFQQAGYAPDVGLAVWARYSVAPGVTDQENPFVNDPGNRTSVGGALVARWSLDFAGSSSRVARARAQLGEIRAQADEARTGMSLEVEIAHAKVADAQRRETAWGEGERQTRRWFLSAAQGYQVGAADPKELVDAVKAYFNARFEHLRAIFDLNSATAELERVTGAPVLATHEWEDCTP